MRRGQFFSIGGGVAILAILLMFSATNSIAKPLSEGGFLGVYTDELDIAMLEALNYDGDGVLVQDVVKDSPADKAEIKPGDILVQVNDRKIISPRSLERVLWRTDPGEQVKIVLWRDGKSRTVTATLTDKPEPDPSTFFFPRGKWFSDSLKYEIPKVGYLGVNLTNLGDQLADYFGAKDGGVLIESVEKDSPAEKAGLMAGDVVVKVDDNTVEETGELSRMIREHKKDDKVVLTVLRNKKEKKITATLGETDGFIWSSDALEPMFRGMARAIPRIRQQIHVPDVRMRVDHDSGHDVFYLQKDAD